MSGFTVAVATWWPVILRSLPQIIKVAQDLYALWCNMRGTRQQNNAVLQAMKLVNKHQDDIDKVLQDPQQKRQLMEGLTILMNRINEHDAGEASAGRNNKAPCSNGDYGASSFSKSFKGSSWKACDVCRSEYNASNKRPIILICGHTFCRDCLVEILRRGRLLCPTCRTHETRSLDSIPPNRGLMRVLEEEEEEGDDSCCGSSDTGGGCDGLPMSYDQQIQYAIFLSQQQAENQGADYVASTWHEVEEAEDLSLAMALQNSEFYEASRLCALRQQNECVNGAMNPPDKKGACDDITPITSEEEGEEASLLLAFELQQEEMALMQRHCGGGGIDDCSNDGAEGWMKDYHTFFGASLCSPVEDDHNLIQGEEKAEDRREEQENRDEEDGAVCCSGNTDEGRKDGEEDGAVCCSGNTDEGRKDGEEKCRKKCNEDDCGKEVSNEECSVWLKAEEDLVQMAIRLSLEQHEPCTLLAAAE